LIFSQRENWASWIRDLAIFVGPRHLLSLLRKVEERSGEFAMNLGEFSFDIKSLPIRDSSEQAELFAQQLLTSNSQQYLSLLFR
jgi:hypothetical protein